MDRHDRTAGHGVAGMAWQAWHGIACIRSASIPLTGMRRHLSRVHHPPASSPAAPSRASMHAPCLAATRAAAQIPAAPSRAPRCTHGGQGDAAGCNSYTTALSRGPYSYIRRLISDGFSTVFGGWSSPFVGFPRRSPLCTSLVRRDRSPDCGRGYHAVVPTPIIHAVVVMRPCRQLFCVCPSSRLPCRQCQRQRPKSSLIRRRRAHPKKPPRGRARCSRSRRAACATGRRQTARPRRGAGR